MLKINNMQVNYLMYISSPLQYDKIKHFRNHAKHIADSNCVRNIYLYIEQLYKEQFDSEVLKNLVINTDVKITF